MYKVAVIFFLSVFFSPFVDGQNYGEPIALAWNEDSVHSVSIALFKEQIFACTVKENDSDGVRLKKYYSGTYQILGDTLFFHYSIKSLKGGRRDRLYAEGSQSQYCFFYLNEKLIVLRLQRNIFSKEHF